MAELEQKLLIDLAVSHYKDGHYEETIRLCSDILILDKAYIAAYYGLTKSLIRLGRYDEALGIYGKALLVSKSKELYKRRGDLYLKLGEYERAYKDYIVAKLLGYNKDEIIPKVVFTFKIQYEARKKSYEAFEAALEKQQKYLQKDDFDNIDEEYMKEMQEEYDEQVSIAFDEYWGAHYKHNGLTKYYDDYYDDNDTELSDWAEQ